MKILQINQTDVIGGAGIAVFRLNLELLKQGIDSSLLVDSSQIGHEKVAEITRQPKLEYQLSRITYRLGLNYLNILNTFDITRHSLYEKADILNFHNLHGNYFNYLAIPHLTRYKPTIWTLHDMWSFTGHCAYSFDCKRWQNGCGKCPYPKTYPAISKDNTNLEWKLKEWVYKRSNLSIVVPSLWLFKLLQNSILKNKIISHIPYGIDINDYAPIPVEKCRCILGIQSYKYVLLFSAQTLSDPRKGGDLLINALELLPNSLKSELILLTFGNYSQKLFSLTCVKMLNFGFINNDRIKAILFSAADLFVFPTRADNLPIVLQESMACGTPMVSFNTGGVSELVRPGITGYLAEPENIQDFSQGIIQLLEDNILREKMSCNCRSIAIKEYCIKLQAKRYIHEYTKLLS